MCNERKIPFRLRKHNVDLSEAYISPSVGDKLGMTARALLPGMITYHEEHWVRKKAGYRLNEWYDLTPQERAFEVALQRVENLIERHLSEASKE